MMGIRMTNSVLLLVVHGSEGAGRHDTVQSRGHRLEFIQLGVRRIGLRGRLRHIRLRTSAAAALCMIACARAEGSISLSGVSANNVFIPAMCPADRPGVHGE
jgi:hypothetical protein